MAVNEIKILIFSLNGENYATDIMEVERILGYEVPTALPEVPFFMDGVINYEESILPVINLAKKFSFPESKITNESKIVVVKESGDKLGIVVENVYEVRDVNKDDVEKPKAIEANISSRYIKGLIRLEGKIIILLDLAKLLNDEERAKIF
ncbi:purine-binding chemotaxis protein CheW [Clostridium cavendishii DSM 21758]|uniref:Purine-binding chemotaxis protein CheW n=1 Tax=Clostridium cavendishii DSM 21758 TaxID=1121302 RepID=A0A1M6B5R6_9CLOT|nr:chemotaxis protein CheW [Clostridium cavendishii]SHI44071.1 purine-binding chemotaxis protein CheW [Clostridium cavendishii DSM 21758]